LLKSRVAKRALEATQQNRVAELLRENAELRAALYQSRIKITEMEEHQSSLCTCYDQLKTELDELFGVADTLEREKVDIEKSCGA
jgi:chromosome segregation ATPase